MKTSSEITQIPLKDIAAHNPECTSNIPIPDLNTVKNRWDFERLFRDVMEHGIKEPITLLQRKDKYKERYEVVDGLQRLRIVEQLGEETIPAIIVQF
jgi:ParB-like chromosome segregation protein Spo0J